MVNGIDELAVTNVDGLDSLDVIRVCVGYRVGTRRFDYVPNDIEVLAKCEPVYRDFPGWRTSTARCKAWKDMPQQARHYLKALADLTGAKLAIVSVGPSRDQTLML
jgi:adenylosuccinate synthase